ncbi:hypothetical protein RIF23_04200 [Lipingzhangella sp. LS1_29]|uniref:Uncharacterized protein n=1 Tax=Lipingzhangella rawalii TaxID=2055835 RepID=A0ABU2H2H6_9ACTN|nr:hypothetical protein [Lipingzhangella rawalii]MDS1269496.1 hypothetical protein [Lipingzhangella rawalii]
MVIDVVRTYLDAASGFTELTRKRAVAAARTLLRESQQAAGSGAGEQGTDENREPSPVGGRTGKEIQTLAAQLVETSAYNRARLTELIEQEVSRQVAHLDVVPRAEYERAVRRIADLERRLATRPSGAGAAARNVGTTDGLGAGVGNAVAGVPQHRAAENPVVDHPQHVQHPQATATAGESAGEPTAGTTTGQTPAGVATGPEQEATPTTRVDGASPGSTSGAVSTTTAAGTPDTDSATNAEGTDRGDTAAATQATPTSAAATATQTTQEAHGEASSGSSATTSTAAGAKQAKRATGGKNRSTKAKSTTASSGKARSTKGTGKRSGQAGGSGGTGASGSRGDADST